MILPKSYQQKYVLCLPEPIQQQILFEVTKTIQTLTKDQQIPDVFEQAKYGKVCDLEDTIHIQYAI